MNQNKSKNNENVVLRAGLYKLISSNDQLEFNIKYNIALPKFSDGMIFQATYSILNDFIQKINYSGTDIFVHNYPEIKDYNTNQDFIKFRSLIEKYQKIYTKKKDIISESKSKEPNETRAEGESNTKIKDLIQISNEIKEFVGTNDETFLNDFDKKWFFVDYSQNNLFRKNVKSNKQSISNAVENITYIYSHDIIKANILNVFENIKKANAECVCIKMLTISSPISLDILKIINYIFIDTFIFKPLTDSGIKDSWYILAKTCNTVKLNEIISKISYSPQNSEFNLGSILKYSNETDVNQGIYKNLVKDIIKVVSKNLDKFS